jgi:hypothetical protein
MNKQIPILDYPFFTFKEVSSPEFNLNIQSNSPGKILYRSSDESVAKVNEYGFVSTVCAGNTNIYVTQLETEEFEGLELCKILYVEKSEQKEIIEEITDDGLNLISEIKKQIGIKPFFDIKISLNSNLNILIQPLNIDIVDFRPIGKNIFRLFPRRIGTGSILLSANGNNCYNSFQKIIPITIVEKDDLVAIDLKLSMFTTEVQHDALEEFTIITSNSGQKTDNTLILQTTLDSKIGNGYSRDIGIINTNPNKLINIVENNIGCCNNFNLLKDIYAIESTDSNIFIGGSFTIFDNFIANRFAKLDEDLNISLNSNLQSFKPLNTSNLLLNIFSLNTDLFSTGSKISNARTLNFTNESFDIFWSSAPNSTHSLLSILEPTNQLLALSGYNNKIISGNGERVFGNFGPGSPSKLYNINITPVSGLITGVTTNLSTYSKIHAPYFCITPTNNTADIEWDAVNFGPRSYGLSLIGPNNTSFSAGPFSKVHSYKFRNLIPNTSYQIRLNVTVNNVSAIRTQNFTTLLSPPSDLRIENRTGTSFNIRWLPVIGATGYIVDVAFDSKFRFLVPNQNNILVTNTNYNVSLLTQSKKYWVRVRGVNSNNILGMPATVSSSTIQNSPIIFIPDDITIDINNENPVYIGEYNLYITGAYSSSREALSPLITTNLNAAIRTDLPSINYLTTISKNKAFTDIIFQTSLRSPIPFQVQVGQNYYIKVQNIFNNITGISNIITLNIRPEVPYFTPLYVNNTLVSFNTVVNATNNSFTLQWPPVTGAENYIINLSKSYNLDPLPNYFNRISNNTGILITGLEPGSVNYLSLQSLNQAGSSQTDSLILAVLTKPADPTYFNYSFDPESQILNFNWARISGVDDDNVKIANEIIDTNNGVTPVFPWPTLSNWDYSKSQYLIEIYEDQALTQFVGRHVETMPYIPSPQVPDYRLNTGYSDNIFEKNGQSVQLTFNKMYYARLFGINVNGTGDPSPILEINTLL